MLVPKSVTRVANNFCHLLGDATKIYEPDGVPPANCPLRTEAKTVSPEEGEAYFIQLRLPLGHE